MVYNWIWSLTLEITKEITNSRKKIVDTIFGNSGEKSKTNTFQKLLK